MFLDIAFGILLLTGLLRGLRRGFAGQVIHVGGIVLGIMFATPLARFSGPRVDPYLMRVSEFIRPTVVYFGSLLAITLVVWIVAGIALSRYRVSTLGAPTASGQDRIFGAILGLLTNVVIICLLIEGIQHMPVQIRDMDFVAVQVDQSLAVQWSRKVPIAPWIDNVSEVRDLFDHARMVGDYLRPGTQEPVEELEQAEDAILKLP